MLEFLEGLVGEVAAIDQEQDAPRPGELDQAVDEGDGGEGLARAGGHLDQGARAVFLEGFFQVVDGRDLGGPEAGGFQGRHGLQAGKEGGGQVGVGGFFRRGRNPPWPPFGKGGNGGGVAKPIGQQVGFMKGEYRARAWNRVQAVGEAGFHTRGLVGERQWVAPGRQPVRDALGVFGGLGFHAGEADAFLLGFDDPGGLAVHVQQVVGEAVAGFQGELADGHAPGGVDVGDGRIADMPTRRDEQRIDVLPCLLFRLNHVPTRYRFLANRRTSQAGMRCLAMSRGGTPVPMTRQPLLPELPVAPCVR